MGAMRSGGRRPGTAQKEEVEKDGSCATVMPVISAASNKTETQTRKTLTVYITKHPKVKSSRADWQLKAVDKDPSSFYPFMPPTDPSSCGPGLSQFQCWRSCTPEKSNPDF